MKIRQLIECTIDIAQPLEELSAVINAVLATVPNAEGRTELLRRLDEEITSALLAEEAEG
ncbi:hypothetical protein DCC85_14210 [Paenibacillus sp. CAA11]|uniref:hypothetical protein n=1 Tax=Paenibacillus sp. CAA11 TaxID=1532905 RepID=UPI000D3605E8|nr:hypothetical protein [Paenibacillus sp. CAA11]AWB45263.1 hypothetical protein DCC85_14210 [Paenibacillus sp. CAA11]